MAKTKHRVLSLVMALVMIFTLLPATAFAAELKPGEVEATKTAFRARFPPIYMMQEQFHMLLLY